MRTIEWNDAVSRVEQHQIQHVAENQKAIENFLEEDHSMTTGRDLQYWIDVTGKDLDWVLANGKNIPQALIDVLNFGADLDDVWDDIY